MEEYQVDRIMDDTGSRAAGTKKYLVRWSGYGEEDDTWEPLDNLVHCAAGVQDYELRQVGVYAIDSCEWEDAKGQAVFSVASTARAEQAMTITLDLNGSETPQEMLNEICRRAGIRQEDIVLAWASPPCETFSRANASNVTRGNRYRLADQAWAPAPGDKGTKAPEEAGRSAAASAVAPMVSPIMLVWWDLGAYGWDRALAWLMSERRGMEDWK